MSPTHNGSSALEHFESGNAIKIRNRIMFDFYLGLPHILNFYSFIPKSTSHVDLGLVQERQAYKLSKNGDLQKSIVLREYQKPVRYRHWSWAWVLVLASIPGSHTLESVHWNYAGVENQVFFSCDHDVIEIGLEFLEQKANVLRIVWPTMCSMFSVYDIHP